MLAWLASYTLILIITCFSSAFVAVAIRKCVGKSFHRAFDPHFRNAVLLKTSVRTENEIQAFYYRALVRKPFEEPFSSKELRSMASRSIVAWAWVDRFLIWTFMTTGLLGLIPLVVERLDIRNLDLGFYGPDRYQSHGQYDWAVEGFFAYLRFVIHGFYFFQAINIFAAIIGVLYAVSPRARVFANGALSKAKARLGFESGQSGPPCGGSL